MSGAVEVFTEALPLLLAILAGALAGGLTARCLLKQRHCPEEPPSTPPTDPFIEVELDLAAVRLAEQRNQPESAGVISERLRLLHHIGTRKGWF